MAASKTKTAPLTAVQQPVIPDPIAAGLAQGWKVLDAATLDADRSVTADVVIVGSGAGGGVTAELLALAGLDVVIVEEGALRSSRDFKMREADAYPTLYQESAARKTRDKAINILQGRTVGGSTTVNWTSSFRTPPDTLAYWQRHYGLRDYSPDALAPWFAMMEGRLGIADWPTPPNDNNGILKRGAEKLSIPVAGIRRNVRGCWNLGYCGMGCPTNAKQSMLVTTIPAALAHGASLYTHTRAQRFVLKGDAIDRLECLALGPDGIAPHGRTLTFRAKYFVLAGGAINSPALLMRSNAPDPSNLLGKRTFLHPTVISSGIFDERVEAFNGAPQTVYSDHFLHTQPVDGPLGYKLEVPPMHPVLLATTMQGFGQQHEEMMREFPHLHAMLALLRDGFHEMAPGGEVELRGDGSPVLDYPLDSFLWDGVRRAYLTMAEIQFAAGARKVLPVHEQAQFYTSWNDAREAIGHLDFRAFQTRVVSAHVMGGCGMAASARDGVTAPDGRYYGLRNLSVHDGSLFPTSVGANPQLSIYGITARLASQLATALTGRPAPRAVA